MANRDDTRDTALINRLRQAAEVAPELMGTVLAHSRRLPQLNGTGRVVARLQGLIQAEAWTDAALALAAIEAPRWTLRRLAHDGNAWQCSLSQQPNLPIELDDAAEGAHPALALAIVLAMIEARSRQPRMEVTAPRQQSRSASTQIICCDNFA